MLATNISHAFVTGKTLDHLTTFDASGYRIADLQLFHDVNEPGVTALLADCAVMRVVAGQQVADANSSGARLYLVLRGALSSTPADGQSAATDGGIVKILPGECVGELSVLDNEASSSALYALLESDVLVIEAEKLWQMIDESNGVARNLLRLLSFRIRAANAQIRRRQKLGEFYRQLSMVDGLTGLQNRAWMNAHFPELISNAHAAGHPLSIIMIDIDHFKQFNDEHGHLQGDGALQMAAKILSAALRPTDFAARYGGEELMVILPHADQKTGMMVAHRLCDRMRQSAVFADMRKPLPHITASFGVASLAPGQDAEALIAMADAALYRAKQSGRDQVAL
jgi:diguanylate cyclase (GGDEF)-like protein